LRFFFGFLGAACRRGCRPERAVLWLAGRQVSYNINMSRVKGFLCGVLTSATFGMIPLFTLPLMAAGMTAPSILCYRFLFSALLLGAVLVCAREPLGVTRRQFGTLFLLSLFYTGSALCLFWGYNYLPSGVATTIIFLYPVFVALLMVFSFGEKASFFTFSAILLALAGVALLSGAGASQGIRLKGVLIEIGSALCYAFYIVGVNQSCVKNMGAWKLTFYVFLFDALTFFLFALLNGGLQAVPGSAAGVNLFLLALVPTVVSNWSLVYAIKSVGSTFSAVLGAFEPVTAMLIGVWVFGEAFTSRLACGLALIIGAVSLIILAPALKKTYRRGKFVYITRVRRIHPGMVPYH